ncbi:multicopper oxidase domain-containing protein [Nocardioides sp. B-3]|uniref:multicopper oxidase domain-containing protein n=1 Tax=Nocardioides sp. B-3 TaxID=2895565 RepID=UPI002152526A|nr:multicopper oxidase domain-containing protein [Nocardioides sp. B-3]UUZ58416.1 multicopper oxidase domain-containing protein [Nocardioides sp. B-3]
MAGRCPGAGPPAGRARADDEAVGVARGRCGRTADRDHGHRPGRGGVLAGQGHGGGRRDAHPGQPRHLRPHGDLGRHGRRGHSLFDVRVPAGTSATITGVELLAEGFYDFFCKLHPQMRGTLAVDGAGGTVTPELPSFDQPLAVPKQERGALVTLPMRLARVRMLATGPRTPMWTYGGSYPGPTIVGRAGRETRVRFQHRLPRKAGAMSVHLHGDHHAPEHDGQPTTQLVRPGQSRTYEYPLTYGGLPEPSSFFFYHDHRMDHTARNNWRGLQGMFIVEDDDEQTLRLPSGSRDVPLMISDRSFPQRQRAHQPVRERAADGRPRRRDGVGRPARSAQRRHRRHARPGERPPCALPAGERDALSVAAAQRLALLGLLDRTVRRPPAAPDRHRQRAAAQAGRARPGAAGARTARRRHRRLPRRQRPRRGARLGARRARGHRC